MSVIEIVSSIVALVILEIVLGVDNLVFLSILTEKLPRDERKKARWWGLTFAWMTRLLLLASAVWIVKMTKPLFVFNGFAISFRDLFLIFGGLFLMMKATQEIHLEVGPGVEELRGQTKKSETFFMVVLQIGIMDVIFSLDSVLTAVGLVSEFWIMAFAITCAILVMIYAADTVSVFIERFPTIKMLALSFLILIGMVLIADGFSFHIPRGYIYFAMGFSLTVEGLNLLRHAKHQQRNKK